MVMHEHCANSVGIASTDHRICLLQLAAAVMLTGLISILRMTICQVTKLFHRNKSFYLLFSSPLSLIVCCCFFRFAFKIFLVCF